MYSRFPGGGGSHALPIHLNCVACFYSKIKYFKESESEMTFQVKKKYIHRSTHHIAFLHSWGMYFDNLDPKKKEIIT